MRLLIDECLSIELVAVAHEFGYEAYHVAHLARGGTRDPGLIPLIIERDFTFVTNNAVDFRRLYQRLGLHAGLILILDQLNRRDQQLVFRAVLRRLSDIDLVNKLLEVTSGSSEVILSMYDLPTL